MQQVPMSVWNEIARSQPLSQPWATLFRLTPQTLGPQLTKLVDEPAEKMGADNRTLLAYRLVAPLLQESEAISQFILETQSPNLRASLPEVVSIKEALILAAKEYRLMPSQTEKLKQLLLSDSMTPSSAKPKEPLNA